MTRLNSLFELVTQEEIDVLMASSVSRGYRENHQVAGEIHVGGGGDIEKNSVFG